MLNKALDQYTSEDMVAFMNENVDAIVVVDTITNKYRAMYNSKETGKNTVTML